MEDNNSEAQTSVDIQVVMEDLGKKIGELTVEVSVLKAALAAASATRD
jgi:hypothetical protein